jgi:hypothetical protein
VYNFRSIIARISQRKMKFTKPVYDASTRIYTCNITDGFRFCVRRESGVFVKDFAECIDTNERISHILKATQGWFSKPLTEEFLKGKIQYDIPTSSIPELFEGSVEWEAKRLVISKEAFMFRCDIIAMQEDEKVCLDFPSEAGEAGEAGEGAATAEDTIPLDNRTEVIAIGPTRRKLQKDEVKRARAKAARALFHAERLIQEYYNSYGDATDWEDEDEDEND